MEKLNIEGECCADMEKKNLFRQPIVIVFGVAAIIAAGLSFKWPAIVALGIAPLLLSVAPCALMCAVGMCGIGNSKTRATAPKSTQDNNS